MPYSLKVSFVKMQRPQASEQCKSIESWGGFTEQVLSFKTGETRTTLGTRGKKGAEGWEEHTLQKGRKG